jgi:16S rRNA (guanine527-N7)-methyltransferase
VTGGPPTGEPVSRETSLTPPQAATDLLGARISALLPYAALLAQEGVERGLLGPREAPKLWDRHLLNCAVVADALPSTGPVIDVGSGAGLPGVVWSLLRADLEFVLVEPLLRRAAFLDELVERLGLRNVTVRRARAEQLHGVLAAPVVTARAVARLDRLTAWCLPLLTPGGTLWALKGQSAAEELANAIPTLPRAAAQNSAIRTYGEGILTMPTTVVQITV